MGHCVPCVKHHLYPALAVSRLRLGILFIFFQYFIISHMRHNWGSMREQENGTVIATMPSVTARCCVGLLCSGGKLFDPHAKVRNLGWVGSKPKKSKRATGPGQY